MLLKHPENMNENAIRVAWAFTPVRQSTGEFKGSARIRLGHTAPPIEMELSSTRLTYTLLHEGRYFCQDAIVLTTAAPFELMGCAIWYKVYGFLLIWSG